MFLNQTKAVEISLGFFFPKFKIITCDFQHIDLSCPPEMNLGCNEDKIFYGKKVDESVNWMLDLLLRLVVKFSLYLKIA